jgi:hypothetical protein
MLSPKRPSSESISDNLSAFERDAQPGLTPAVAVSYGTNNSRADNLMRHIMVATDGSSGANRAVDVAAELAKAVAGDLQIVTVADSLAFEEAQQLARAEGSIGECVGSIDGPDAEGRRSARSPLWRIPDRTSDRLR